MTMLTPTTGIGGDFPERSEEEETGKKLGRGIMADSKSNESEAALVRVHVQKLVDAGVKPDDIAVITPYNAQVSTTVVPLPSASCKM